MNLDPKTLYDSLFKMLVPIIAGFVVAKAGVFGDEYPKKLSHFVLYLAQPFMLVTSVMGIEYSDENLKSGLTVLLCGVVVHVLCAVIAFGATLPYKDKPTGRISEHCMVFANCSFFGFPLLKAVWGDIGVFYGGFYIIAFNIVMWSYGVFILSRANMEMKIKVAKIIFNAGTIPCVLGFVLYLLRVDIYAPVFDSMKMIGDTCTPLSMIIIGMMLAKIPVKKYITELSPYYTALIKLVLLPIIAGVVLSLIGFSETFAVFGALMAALPSASSSAMFAQSYDVRPEFAAQTVGISTLLSVITIPPIMQLVQYIV